MRDLSGKRDADNKAGPHPKALLAKACSSPCCARLCKPSVQELEMVVARGRFALKVCFPQHPFVGGIRASHRLCFHLHGWRSPAVKAVPGEGRRLRSRNSLELEQSTALGKPTQPCAQTVLQMPHFWTALDTCFYLYLFFFFPLSSKVPDFGAQALPPGHLPSSVFFKHHFLLHRKVLQLFGEKNIFEMQE